MGKSGNRSSKLLKPSEVAEMLSVNRRTVYNWIRSGRVKAVKICSGKRVWLRIPEDEIKKLIGGH
jgi:excisionase family DNA binding protein